MIYRLKNQLVLLFVLFSNLVTAQTSKVFTSDIDNFWIAYDSLQTTTDTAKQIHFLKTLYFDKATDGLQEFIAATNLTPKKQLNTILRYPKFWTSVRPNTLKVHDTKSDIEKSLNRLKILYPDLKQLPSVYFTIGDFTSGGRPTLDKVLIGTEIASADSTVDASELGAGLRAIFKINEGPMQLVTHETGHTLQMNFSKNDDSDNLLAYCIGEGACDLIAELLLEREFKSPYMEYGKTHEAEIWTLFQKEMYGQDRKNWLYNGSTPLNGVVDLGYFVGYAICKSYYDNAQDKAQAIKDIIELEYTPESVQHFLEKSKYNGGQS